MQLGDGTAGHDSSLTSGNIINNSAMVYDVGANQSYAGAISGSGNLIKTGPGRLVLAGSLNYSGKTLVTSGTLAFDGPSTGLYEGLVSNTNGADTADPIPKGSIQRVARWGASNSVDPNNDANTNVFPYWGNTTTWGYSGYLDNTSRGTVTYTFGKDFDDAAFLTIDGQSVISDGQYNSYPTASISLAPGLHTVDLRFGQDTGLVGPNGTAGNNGGPAFDGYGIAYNTVGNTAGTGTWFQMGASGPNTQFFATNVAGTSSTSVVLSSNTTLDLHAEQRAGLGDFGVARRRPRSADGPASALGRQHA